MAKEIKVNNQFGLVGKNIEYSFSRSYFSKKFQAENIHSTSYINFDIDTIESIVDVLKTPNLKGLNVTIPYKESIIPYLDSFSEEAKTIGAVNTVCFLKDGTTQGHNTDAFGFKTALLKKWKKKEASNALILGTGGASKAIQFVLEQMKIKPLLVSRKPSVGQIEYNQIDKELMRTHQLIINTSPIGVHPNIDKAPKIPYEFVSSEHFLFDLIYNPAQTLFLKEGEKRRATTQNGLLMLEQQAEKSWEIWNQNND